MGRGQGSHRPAGRRAADAGRIDPDQRRPRQSPHPCQLPSVAEAALGEARRADRPDPSSGEPRHDPIDSGAHDAGCARPGVCRRPRRSSSRAAALAPSGRHRRRTSRVAFAVEMLFEALDPSHASGGSVTFEPRARTAWHSHPRGQILIVTAGTGRVQLWGGPIEEIRAGDVVRIPAGQKHWHGASPQASMTHIAMTEHRDGTDGGVDGEGERRAVQRAAQRSPTASTRRRPPHRRDPSPAEVRARTRDAHGRCSLRRRVATVRAVGARPQPRHHFRPDCHW